MSENSRALVFYYSKHARQNIVYFRIEQRFIWRPYPDIDVFSVGVGGLVD